MYDEDKNPIIKTTCLICGKECGSVHKLSTHAFNTHRVKIKDYIDMFFIEARKTCKNCGKETKFRGGKYQDFCPKKCYFEFSKNNNLLIGKGLGKKQSKETIEKRIKNTDQKKKEQTRRETCLKRYGVENCSLLETQKKKISEKTNGRKHPRTKEWQNKIIESKKRNGTTRHSEKTKEKLRVAQAKINESDNPPVRISNNYSGGRGNGYKRGFYLGLYYRSSYELEFIKLCEKNNIKIESAENKTFRCPYVLNNKKRMYYPDFYLPDYNIVIEIKPESMLNLDEVQAKIHAGASNLTNFILITEENLFNEPDILIWEIKNCFKEENEYIFS